MKKTIEVCTLLLFCTLGTLALDVLFTPIILTPQTSVLLKLYVFLYLWKYSKFDNEKG